MNRRPPDCKRTVPPFPVTTLFRSCDKKPPEEPPESTAFLEIVDVRPDAPTVELFTGWMFASSPAISALEHPVYDVWVVDCKKASSSSSRSEEHTSELQSLMRISYAVFCLKKKKIQKKNKKEV